MGTKIQLRRGTASAWTAANPVLLDGEMGLETDTDKVKFGDGTSNWVSLPYFSAYTALDQRRVYFNPGKSVADIVTKSGTAPAVVTSATAMGGKAISKNGGALHGWWEDRGGMVEFDPQVLYRFHARVRVVTPQTNGAGKGFYFGPVGFSDAGGVTYVNASGTNSSSSQQWTTQNSQTATDGTWVDYISYVRGWNATAGISGSGTLASPRTLYPGTTHFCPGFILDYNNGNGIWELSHWSIEAVGAEVQDLQNAINSHSAANLTSGTISDARLPTRLGVNPATITDWNTAITTGWHMGYNIANQPTANSGWWMGTVVAHNSLWVSQTVHQFTGDSAANTQTYRRSSSDVSGVRTWSAWYKVQLSQQEQDARYALVSHTHAVADTTGLQAALDGKADTVHVHNISATTGLQAALDNKSDIGHTHSGTDITGINGGTPNGLVTSTQLRRGTASEWTSYDPVLSDGEIGLETDTGKLKFGNGIAAWSALNYAIPGGSGLQTHDSTGAWKGFQAAMANCQNTPLRWLAVGDSITEGTGVTSRAQTWPIIVAQKLRAAYPSVPQTNPFGWIPIVQASSTLPSNFTLAGSYSTTTAKFGFRGDQTVTLNANATITGTITGTSIDVWHAKGASSGTFTVKKNGVQVGGSYGGTNATTQSGFKQSVSLGTSGTYTIVITNNSANPVYINGITAWNGNENAGVMVANAGRHGWTSQNWETVALDGSWVDDVKTLDPHLVTILLGANDYTSLVGRTAYKDNLRTVINTIRDTQNYWSSIVLVACFKRSEVAYPRWEHYEFAMQDLATELGCGYIDLREFMPDVGTAEAIDNSYYYDTVHPATAGMARMGDEISKILLARANGLF